MTETIYFLSGFFLCMAIALVIIVIIHKKLSILLSDLCEGESRAQFWAYAVEVWFFLYSISSALRWCPEGLSDRQLFFASIHQIKDGLKRDVHSHCIIFCDIDCICAHKKIHEI